MHLSFGYDSLGLGRALEVALYARTAFRRFQALDRTGEFYVQAQRATTTRRSRGRMCDCGSIMSRQDAGAHDWAHGHFKIATTTFVRLSTSSSSHQMIDAFCGASCARTSVLAITIWRKIGKRWASRTSVFVRGLRPAAAHENANSVCPKPTSALARRPRSVAHWLRE